MNTEIGKQRVVGWVLGKYCAKDLRYVLLDGHDAEVIRHDSLVSELNNQLDAQAAYSSMQFDRIAELTDEVAEVRELNRKLGLNNDKLRAEFLAIETIAGDSRATPAIQAIARNALKEGL